MKKQKVVRAWGAFDRNGNLMKLMWSLAVSSRRADLLTWSKDIRPVEIREVRRRKK